MIRRALLGLVVLAACDRDVEDGFFEPTTTPMPTTVAPTTNPGSGTDDGASESSDGAAESGGASASETTDAVTGPVDQPDPSDADTGADPTFGDPIDESSGGVDPTSAESTDPTVDPTGVDPTGVDPTGADGACCDVQIGPGCDDATIEACVCSFDDYCCSTQWDDVCVSGANDCGAGCGGGGGGGDCCTAQGVPGCSDGAIEACVCSFDPFCCDTQWDDTCVLEASDCGAFC